MALELYTSSRRGMCEDFCVCTVGNCALLGGNRVVLWVGVPECMEGVCGSWLAQGKGCGSCHFMFSQLHVYPSLLCLVMLELDHVSISFSQLVQCRYLSIGGAREILPGQGISRPFSGFRPPLVWELPLGAHLSSRGGPTPCRCSPHPAATLPDQLQPHPQTLLEVVKFPYFLASF